MVLSNVDKCDASGDVVFGKVTAAVEKARLEMERQAVFARRYSGGHGVDPVLGSHLGLGGK